MNHIHRAQFIQSAMLVLALIAATPVAQGRQIAVSTSDYPTLGNPTSAVATVDGRYVFVSVTNAVGRSFAGSDQPARARPNPVSGIQIFQHSDSSHLKSIGFFRIGSTEANGMVLLTGDRTLAVAVGDAGVAFLSVSDLIRGNATPYFAAQTDQSGTFDVVASPDGKFVFAANEYGIVQGHRGSVGVIAVNADSEGSVQHPRTLGQLPVGDVVPSLTLSPDGTRLYVATELVPQKEPPAIAGAGNPMLTKHDCVQKIGTPPRANGFVTVIDTQRATESQSNAVLARVAAGCSPVRLVETADASALFVSARGDDAILAFDPRLLESDPEHALIRVLSSGGSAPVGIRLFDSDRLLAVANSNRFADANGTVAVLDVTDLSSRTLPPLKTWAAGTFPRNIGISHDCRILYLTNFTSRGLQLIETTVQ